MSFHVPSGWRRTISIALKILDRLPRRLNHRALPVGVQQGDVAGGNYLDNPALQSRPRADQFGQHETNPVVADNRFARLRHEARVRFVQRDDRLEIAGVELLLKQTWPILRLVSDIFGLLDVILAARAAL
jgi:hypothetical protein